MCDRFTDISKRGKMDHRVDAMTDKHLIQMIGIPQIALDQFPFRDGTAMTINQVIEYRYVMPLLEEQLDGVTANIPGPACDQYSHSIPPVDRPY
jgi:hypothetical protein